MPVDRDQLEAVLEAAGDAHHTAFAHVEGEDPEWARWYAHHTLSDLRRLLEHPALTEDTLRAAFEAAANAHAAEGGDVPWPSHYAARFAEQLAGER